MSLSRGQASVRPQGPAASAPRRGRPTIWVAAIVVLVIGVAAAEHTAHGASIVSSVQEFLLKYAGVFALIFLTTAVGVGVLATDRIVMRPGSRVIAQSVHRGVSLAAVAALVAHIFLEIMAHRVSLIGAVVPFASRFRTLYTGIGVLAAYLLILIVITGALRGRFAGRRPRSWRAIHVSAYLCWLFAVVHGLLGGRTAKPYVDWSYGGCMAMVALALTVRFVAAHRTAEEKAAHPVSDRLSVPAEGLIPGTRVTMAPLGGPQPARRELTSGAGTAVAPPFLASPTMAAPGAAFPGAAFPGRGFPGASGPSMASSALSGPVLPASARSPLDRAAAAELAQVRYSQAQQLQTQQRQAQARHERLMRQESPAQGSASGWTPGESARNATRDWRDDVDVTDPRGWISAGDPADTSGWTMPDDRSPYARTGDQPGDRPSRDRGGAPRGWGDPMPHTDPYGLIDPRALARGPEVTDPYGLTDPRRLAGPRTAAQDRADPRTSGSYRADPRPSGSYLADSRPSGSYLADPRPSGSYPADPHPSGPYLAAPPASGPYLADPHPSGPYLAAPPASGPYLADPHPSGPYLAAPPASGPYLAGPHPSGPYLAGPHPSGPYLADPRPSGQQAADPRDGLPWRHADTRGQGGGTRR